MEIERFYLGCLAHASYLVFDGDEAAVIDPQRDVDGYIAAAAERGLRIRWVIETHLHADFVSGHLELAQRTGATICVGAGAEAGYPHRALVDGDVLPLGSGELRCMATPGHTEEGFTIVAYEVASASKPLAAFTGDTLFIGDVGRPDLSPTKTPEQLASMLYDSLHYKLLALPDETVIYPAHGAGSLCGRQMSSDASSTIGRERATNYALLANDRAQFIELVTADQPPRPQYFQDEVERNRSGAVGLDALPAIPAVDPEALMALQRRGVVVLDVRSVLDFSAAHIPGSIHLALSGQFASWAARILGIDTEVLLVAEDDDAAQEARMRLARVGLERVTGYLQGSVYGWMSHGYPAKALTQIAAPDLTSWLEEQSPRPLIVDVREGAERATGAIPGSMSLPLPEVFKGLTDVPQTTTLVVHCKGGYRSSCAASILLSRGFSNIVNLTGGYDGWSLSPQSPT